MNDKMQLGTVLIVDDSIENLNLLSQMLIGQGYKVRAAKTGLEALESINEHVPELIILDIKLPDTDGFEVCRCLKAQSATKLVPVLFLSMLSDTEDKLKGFKVGGADYITKPFVPEEVLLRVHTQMEISKLVDKQASDLVQVNVQLKDKIEDYKRAEDLLKASEMKFRTVADYTYDWEYWENENHHIYYTSPSCERITGYTQDEFIVDPNLLDRIVHPEDFKDFNKHKEMVFSSQNRNKVDDLKFRIVNKNGSLVFIHHICRPIFDEKDRFVGRRVSNRDVTDNEKAARELTLAHSKLKSLWNIAKLANHEFKLMCDGILENLVKMTNSEFGFYGFMNDDETEMTIHSCSGEAMKGCSITNKTTDFPIDEAGVWSQAVKLRRPFILNNYSDFHDAKKGLPEGHVSLSNLLVIPQISNGKIVSISAVANKVDDYNEDDIIQINAFIGGIQHITELKRTEKELVAYKNRLEELVKARTENLNIVNEELIKQIDKEKEYKLLLQKSLDREIELNKMKSDLISTASHEFRTPLTTILSSTELLQRYGAKWSDEKKEEHVDRIKREVDYLTKLLDDVLLIGEKENGKISFNPQLLNMRNLIQECLDDAKVIINEHHEIHFRYLSERDDFIADNLMMRYIIRNLLSNAIKFSPKGGKVELQVSSNDFQLKIELTDHGIGIPNSETSLILQPFYRASNVNTFDGAGLGLAIAKHAIDLHRGEITFLSELEKGSTITVKIPIVPAA